MNVGGGSDRLGVGLCRQAFTAWRPAPRARRARFSGEARFTSTTDGEGIMAKAKATVLREDTVASLAREATRSLYGIAIGGRKLAELAKGDPQDASAMAIVAQELVMHADKLVGLFSLEPAGDGEDGA